MSHAMNLVALLLAGCMLMSMLLRELCSSSICTATDSQLVNVSKVHSSKTLFEEQNQSTFLSAQHQRRISSIRLSDGHLCNIGPAHETPAPVLVPIFLIVKDRLGVTREMLHTIFPLQGLLEVVLLDQGSTYPPMTEYLSEWKANNASDPPVSVVHQRACDLKGIVDNVASYVASYLKDHASVEFYVVSDPDLSLRACKKDMLELMTAVMRMCPAVAQVGTSLRMDNIPDSYHLKQKALSFESKYWSKPFVVEWKGSFVHVFEAPVDTTFAMHRGTVPYGRLVTPSIRTGAPYMAEHIPW